MLLPQEKAQETQQQEPNGVHSKAELAGAPPSYEASTAQAGPSVAGPSGVSPPSNSVPPSMRSNYVQVITPHRSINSKAVIDLGLPELPNLNPTRSTRGNFLTHDGSKPNCYLSSQYQSVSTALKINDSTASAEALPIPKRAFIVAQSENGNVVVEILSRLPSTRLHICAESRHGNVIIRLPRDFHGPVKCRRDNLQSNPLLVRFAPRIRANISVFSVEETEAYAFVGEVPNAHSPTSSPPAIDVNQPLENHSQDGSQGTAPMASISSPAASLPSMWAGDQVEVIAQQGRIKICYTLMEGEEKEPEGEFETLIRHVQESGPIAAIVKMAARGVTKVIQNSKKQKEAEPKT